MKTRGRHRPATWEQLEQRRRLAQREAMMAELRLTFGPLEVFDHPHALPLTPADRKALDEVAARVRYNAALDCWVCQACGALVDRGCLHTHFATHGGTT